MGPRNYDDGGFQMYTNCVTPEKGGQCRFHVLAFVELFLGSCVTISLTVKYHKHLALLVREVFRPFTSPGDLTYPTDTFSSMNRGFILSPVWK